MMIPSALRQPQPSLRAFGKKHPFVSWYIPAAQYHERHFPCGCRDRSFVKQDEYFFDREDATWPTSQAELDEIWRERVKYDALRLKMTGKDWEGIKEVLTKRYKNAEKRLVQSNSEDAFQIVLNSLARTIEAHTSYLSPRRAEQFKMDMDLELEGIGAVLTPDEDYTVIRSLVPGGPADKTEQIKADDRIIGVAQDGEDFTDVIGWRLDDVVDLIKGPKGTKVRLQYLKGADAHGTPKVVEITRDKIRLEDRAAKSEVFEAKYSDLSSKIGVIEIPGFYNNLSKDVKVELAKLKEAKVDGIIIDLRQNGGGSLYEATQLSGLFFDQGPVVQIHTLNNRIEEQRDRDGVTYYDGPLTVLVDRYSASASEIFAGAIQDYKRGVILGEQSYGKGTVQNVRGLQDFLRDKQEEELGLLKYTIAKFYRASGGSTQHKGVTPDIQYPSIYNAEEFGESSKPSALPWDQIPTADFTPLDYVNDDLLKALRTRHNQRLKNDQTLVDLQYDVEQVKKDRMREQVSLNLSVRQKEKKEREEKRAARVKIGASLTELEANKVEDRSLEDLKDTYLKESIKLLADQIQSGKSKG